jgi:hypothetical protein
MFQPELAGPDLQRQSGLKLRHNPRIDREGAGILTRHPGLHIRSPDPLVSAETMTEVST